MERPPTYEEVQAFAKSEGLDSKTNIQKFYNYYSRSRFLFKGIPMDWKAKLREWAGTEKPRSESKSMANMSRKYEPVTWEYLNYIEEVTKGWGK